MNPPDFYVYVYWNQGLRCAEPQQMLFAILRVEWRNVPMWRSK